MMFARMTFVRSSFARPIAVKRNHVSRILGPREIIIFDRVGVSRAYVDRVPVIVPINKQDWLKPVFTLLAFVLVMAVL